MLWASIFYFYFIFIFIDFIFLLLFYSIYLDNKYCVTVVCNVTSQIMRYMIIIICNERIKNNTKISFKYIAMVYYLYCYDLSSFVIVTTHWNGTHDMLTSAKLTVGYLVVRITRELDKEPLLYCSFIYINTMWSMLQQYLLALMSICLPHVLLLIHHKATIPYICVLTSYSLISAVHVCTMYTPWGTIVPWHHS